MNKSTLLIVDGNSDIKYPTVNAVKQYVDSVLAISGGINNNQIINVVDASATTKGIVQLAGDLAGTAQSPIIAMSAITTSKIATAAVTDDKIAIGINPAKVGLQNVNNTLFVGSYFGYGFHEDGIKSSIEMLKNFND